MIMLMPAFGKRLLLPSNSAQHCHAKVTKAWPPTGQGFDRFAHFFTNNAREAV